MKKRWMIAAALLMVISLTGCGAKVDENKDAFKINKVISVITREEGSGTRGAFIELTGVEEKGAGGTKTDRTSKEAITANKTAIVMTNVTQDMYSVGYISLGSLNSNVKALDIDGVPATATNVKDGTYQLARPFHVAMKGEGSELAQDFLAFVLSGEGQEVVNKSYIAINDAAMPYAGSKPSGKLVIAGSSSVAPIMEKLAEAYKTINSGAVIELQESDSSAGMMAAIDGICDIGMASRDLKEAELAVLTATPIALDGIVVIVNMKNPINSMTTEQIKNIFIGTIITWDAVK